MPGVLFFQPQNLGVLWSFECVTCFGYTWGCCSFSLVKVGDLPFIIWQIELCPCLNLTISLEMCLSKERTLLKSPLDRGRESTHQKADGHQQLWIQLLRDYLLFHFLLKHFCNAQVIQRRPVAFLLLLFCNSFCIVQHAHTLSYLYLPFHRALSLLSSSQ